MTLYEALHDWLCQQEAVTALIGQRVYQQQRPQRQTKACLVITEITAAGGHHQTGSDSLIDARVQLDAWSTSVGECRQIRDAVRQAIAGLSGEIADPAVTVERVFVENRILDAHRTAGGGEEVWYQGSLDTRILYRE